MSQRPNPTPPPAPGSIKADLKPGPLARPLDPANMGHDSLAAKHLAAMMNDPRLNIPLDASQPVVKIDPSLAAHTLEALNAPPVIVAAPAPDLSTANSTTDQPVAGAAASPSHIVFLTGQPGTAIEELINGLKATEIPVAAGAANLVKLLFGLDNVLPSGQSGFQATVETIRAWGDNEISEKYPLTPARWLFVDYLNRQAAEAEEGSFLFDLKGFGTQNFWLQALLGQASFSTNAVITGVNTLAAFKFLQGQGVQHWHVMCNPATRGTRLKLPTNGKTAPVIPEDKFITKLDQSVIAQVSKVKNGPKLHVVWNDFGGAPPSQRVYTVQQFLAERATVAQTESVESAITGE